MNYFKSSDFDSPDEPGSGARLDPNLLDALDYLQDRCEFKFVITSAVRSAKHNEDVGGVAGSEHLLGQAVDISVANGMQRYRLVEEALMLGITRIGIKKDCIHLGVSPTLPQRVIWTYD